jgi:spermidine/putrescine transport system ATP-binding protein
MSLLRVRGLTKRFGGLLAVDDVDFDVADGEFVSILGPSGSGKSTVLRMIAGFETPTDGSIALNGEPVVGTPPFERDVNMVFQDLALFPHLTVAENIGYGLKQAGVPADERRDRAGRMLEMVRLDGYDDRMPDELSGGEQQRVALARALVNEPALVLFDEPLSSLDRKLRQHMQSELQRLQAETETTFLYVTHDQEVALAVSDRLVVLDDGAIQQIGTVEALYEDPQSRFVADFIGDVNTVTARVTDATDETITVDVGSDRVSIPRSVADDVAIDASVDVCVRPFRIRVGPAGTKTTEQSGTDGATADGGDLDRATDAEIGETFTTTGTVRSRSYQGSDSLYEIATDEWGRLTAEVRSNAYEPDEQVAVAWDASDVHVFSRSADDRTGDRGDDA